MTQNAIINIRAFEPRDIPDLHNFYCLPEIAQATSQIPYLNYAQVEQLFMDDNRHMLVATKTSPQAPSDAQKRETVIGHVTLFLSSKPRRKHCASLAIAVHPASQNLGVGLRLMQHAIDQADNWLNLVRLELDVYADNTHAIKLYEKMGFLLEGRKVKGSFKAGNYVDMLSMARVRDTIPN